MTTKQASELCAKMALQDYEMHRKISEGRDSAARVELVVCVALVLGLAALLLWGVC